LSNPFTDAFDNNWPYPIYWVPNQVAGKLNSSGVFTAGAAPTPVLIKGHLMSYGTAERSRLESDWGASTQGRDRHDSSGPIESGDRLFMSETQIPKGDLVEFWLNVGGTQKTTYRVISLNIQATNLLRVHLGVTPRCQHHLRETPT
jgi:hypothetical protein